MKETLQKMEKLLTPQIQDFLRLSGKLANSNGQRAYCVGGFVRSMLLGIDNFDIDITIEGDGLLFARRLAEKLKGSLTLHKQFATATVLAKHFKIDVATAREEIYKYPAAYPKVFFSTIRKDLKRRDFTINAMAISLNSRGFGKLLDFFNGADDLRKKSIKVLHDKSFIDDPTRIFRAVRFEQRLNFTISKNTQRLIKDAVAIGLLDKIGKNRLKKEIDLIKREKAPKKVFKRLKQLLGENNVSNG